MEKGAVTDGYKADLKTVLRILSEALATGLNAQGAGPGIAAPKETPYFLSDSGVAATGTAIAATAGDVTFSSTVNGRKFLM
jgi:hypothetical protein